MFVFEVLLVPCFQQTAYMTWMETFCSSSMPLQPGLSPLRQLVCEPSPLHELSEAEQLMVTQDLAYLVSFVSSASLL